MADKDGDVQLEQKRQFYSGLDDALTESDEEPDTGRQASVAAMKRAAEDQLDSGLRANASHRLPRSVSATNLAAKHLPAMHDQTVDKRPTAAKCKPPPTLKKGATFSGAPSRSMGNMVPPSSAIAKLTGKRKRESEIKLMPEAQQVFKGLTFYFFPNDDKNPARRMRITKAREFGVTWQKDWSDCITHVIVDKVMEYSLLLRFLKRDRLPNNVVLVTENYPSECISFRAMLDPKQAHFKVKGYAQPEMQEPKQQIEVARPVSAGSDKSLQLKPAGKAVKARHPETPGTPDEHASSQRTNESQIEQMLPPRKGLDVMTTSEKVGPSPQSESTDEFEAAIRQARELQFVPLEPEEDGESRPTSSGGPETDDEEAPKPGFQLLKQRKSKYERMQDKWQCMQKHTGERNSPNEATVAILQQMADYYNQLGDEWRTRAYRKAMSTLRNHPTKVWTKAEALALPQIGERLATKIEEIAFTNRLRRLDNARAEPTDLVLQTFMQVYGAGFTKASEWVSQGFTTLDEVLEKADLTDNQRIGIEHYVDFNSRIPRAEVEQHGSVVRKTLQKIDPAFEVIVGGSYRRGAQDSGDIDCMITRPDTGSAHLHAVILEQLVPKLAKSGFLVASLATTNKDDGSKWHGASRLPGSETWRRIDLLLVPSDEIGAALIYFTGNDIFNRSLRLLASTKGMRLNQRGLYKDVIRGKGREKLSEGTLVEGKSEKRIFEVLGVPWRPPEHRIC
ncbi:hypothetical protein LTR36_005261 [Oleoguttula mirabilis]|uniref:DNA polymerase lambda n=1 Tax=Oleoguttula mirabilis TaxID=1507867 RepID=A0AAV9JES4_9PEZI|nr:hypothetical protein LTR36_005261 [Oleoguttula mirabilis]